MLSKGMSTKEKTLQLSPQFHSTSTSESESETKISLIKIEKYIMCNQYLNRFFFAFLSLKTY